MVTFSGMLSRAVGELSSGTVCADAAIGKANVVKMAKKPVFRKIRIFFIPITILFLSAFSKFKSLDKQFTLNIS
jgi:hypothetical protein